MVEIWLLVTFRQKFKTQIYRAAEPEPEPEPVGAGPFFIRAGAGKEGPAPALFQALFLLRKFTNTSVYDDNFALNFQNFPRQKKGKWKKRKLRYIVLSKVTDSMAFLRLGCNRYLLDLKIPNDICKNCAFTIF